MPQNISKIPKIRELIPVNESNLKIPEIRWLVPVKAVNALTFLRVPKN